MKIEREMKMRNNSGIEPMMAPKCGICFIVRIVTV
jgi:hypothetical protein